MTTDTATKPAPRSRSHASRAASATQSSSTLHAVPDDDVRAEPSPAALADRAASKRRGEQIVTDPQPAPAVEPKIRGAVGKRQADLANKPKPKAAKPAGLSDQAKRLIALSELERAAAELISAWDAGKSGISAADAKRLISDRLSYDPAGTAWHKGLAPRKTFASRSAAK